MTHLPVSSLKTSVIYKDDKSLSVPINTCIPLCVLTLDVRCLAPVLPVGHWLVIICLMVALHLLYGTTTNDGNPR